MYISPVTKLGGYWNHHIHLSVCVLSICLCVQRISFEVLNSFAATHGMVVTIMGKSVLLKQWVDIFKVKASLRADITKI